MTLRTKITAAIEHSTEPVWMSALIAAGVFGAVVMLWCGLASISMANPSGRAVALRAEPVPVSSADAASIPFANGDTE